MKNYNSYSYYDKWEYKEVFDCYTLAENGNAEAQYNLGVMYSVQKDYTQAKGVFE
ncbi:hypothetical protein [Riemerella columbipharyngis]|uniref:hypothetical protein n=1 Tax=Riemerella columbipharyngis TaxID=1071918 RepID=UPI00159FFEFE|nr:hypothetical protein [Riemerella columbipharyngis]